jgi:thioredoxin-related protein
MSGMSRLSGIMKGLALVIALSGPGQAKPPEGWPFLDFNEAVETAKRLNKPLFVYFGFETCPYCLYLNEHALASESLRKLYSSNYVLAYFDIRGEPDDVMNLPDGRKLTRREAIKELNSAPVPAWMFVEPGGKTVLMRRGSRTRVNEFWKYDLYVAGGGYRQGSFEEFLAKRGLREEKAE